MKGVIIGALGICIAFYSLTLRADRKVIDFGPAFGVSIHRGSLKSGDLERIHNAGFTWIRTDLFWEYTERQRGHYDFSQFDKFVAELEANHLHALIILDYGNPLYGQKTLNGRDNTDAFRQAYAAFSVAAVGRYAGRGFIWGQWNEPNHKKVWLPSPDSAEYIALMKVAAQAIRERYPDEMLVGPATAGIDFDFVEDCLRAGMMEFWSGISVHPYRDNPPDTAAKDYAKLRALIARYSQAATPVPIICEEWGYSTARRGFDDAKQADYLARMFRLSQKENIPLTIWYDWRDDGDDPSNKEHRFGLVRRAAGDKFDPKPSYQKACEILAAPAR